MISWRKSLSYVERSTMISVDRFYNFYIDNEKKIIIQCSEFQDEPLLAARTIWEMFGKRHKETIFKVGQNIPSGYLQRRW